jgi:hypothetical protein
MKRLYIYLSGSIQKSHTANTSVWTSTHTTNMASLFLEKRIEVTFLNPASRSDDLSNSKSIFGRDLLQVYLSDCVLVDGRDRRGIGIGYEMAVANYKNIPVFSWIPKGSHYNPKEIEMMGQRLYDWKHPFFYTSSAKVVDSLEEAVNTISSFAFPVRKPLSQDDFIFAAMQHYVESNLKKDIEMYNLMTNDSELQARMKPLAIPIRTA